MMYKVIIYCVIIIDKDFICIMYPKHSFYVLTVCIVCTHLVEVECIIKMICCYFIQYLYIVLENKLVVKTGI